MAKSGKSRCADCEGYDSRNRWCLLKATTVSSPFKEQSCKFFTRSEEFEYKNNKPKKGK